MWDGTQDDLLEYVKKISQLLLVFIKIVPIHNVVFPLQISHNLILKLLAGQNSTFRMNVSETNNLKLSAL